MSFFGVLYCSAEGESYRGHPTADALHGAGRQAGTQRIVLEADAGWVPVESPVVGTRASSLAQGAALPRCDQQERRRDLELKEFTLQPARLLGAATVVGHWGVVGNRDDAQAAELQACRRGKRRKTDI